MQKDENVVSDIHRYSAGCGGGAFECNPPHPKVRFLASREHKYLAERNIPESVA